MSRTTPSRDQLIATALNFIQSYNQWDLQAIMAIRSPICIHYTLPATLEVPPRSNADYLTFMGPMLSAFRAVHFSVISDDETVVDIETRRVVLHCSNRADTDAGEYTNEYMFTLTMSEDGEKIDSIVEFIDAAYTTEFKRRMSLTWKSAHAVNDA
ncbi:hypothetical protein COCMIDRAFT_37702 [Bipolaris oryzae ATCC 44560]|uniref:SnoaL-like domain-containing protein n=1 Tax=Bipolaris oryzae ATCC 44560 TaxID=930090 RepID=W6Z3V8_COCMI|nr:uncharacterized protein COCMIDRAFT_37702 [Bipolaris oryzae ATCC 44560]EUC44428.1 hypothetical protein COCMIDRAFT_37702 [Bipolaris oryzae ATCC 44560]